MSGEEEAGLGYWLRWQVPVCALAIIGPSLVAIYVIKKVKAEPLYSDQLWKPCWRNVNPLWLLLYRLLAFTCLASILYQIVALDGAFAFYFYTQWTFTLVMAYFALGTIISANGCWMSSNRHPFGIGEAVALFKIDEEEEEEEDEEDGKSTSLGPREKEMKGTIKFQGNHSEEAIQQRAGFWGYLLQIMYQICGGAAILTDIVFWCVIVPFLTDEHFSLNVLMGCMHSLNVIFLVLDTIFNSLPFPWFRFAYFVHWSCLYIVFQWVIHACGYTWWPYPFLELNTPWAPLWYFALAVVHVPCYAIYTLIFNAKQMIFPKLFPHDFVRSS